LVWLESFLIDLHNVNCSKGGGEAEDRPDTDSDGRDTQLKCRRDAASKSRDYKECDTQANNDQSDVGVDSKRAEVMVRVSQGDSEGEEKASPKDSDGK
jgi:hypothetical protein